MKKIFYYLLPLLLLNQSGTAQQDSLTLRITDEKGQIIIGAVVLQYPESYLLGASNEKGEVEIKGLHIPAPSDTLRLQAEKSYSTCLLKRITSSPLRAMHRWVGYSSVGL